jgi:hypothetical protein
MDMMGTRMAFIPMDEESMTGRCDRAMATNPLQMMQKFI